MNGRTPTIAGQRLGCAQCGRPLPDDAAEVARWKHGYLAAAGELDETSLPLLVCPECAEEKAPGDYDAGDAD